MLIEPRKQRLLAELRHQGALSRWELHERTEIRPNTVGSDMQWLIDLGIVRECAAKSEGRGRPRVPLEIDPDTRRVAGISIARGMIEMVETNPLGKTLTAPVLYEARDTDTLLATLRQVVEQVARDEVLGIGICLPGVIDADTREVLLSSAMPSSGPIDLSSVLDAAGNTPVILGNDMQAVSAKWVLDEQVDTTHDLLLVYLDDGQMGASMLVSGQPNRGCVIGGNELGHTRFPIETDQCFCGRTGCLERIFSSTYLSSLSNNDRMLSEALENHLYDDVSVGRVLDLICEGLANAVNFTRVHALVLMTPCCQSTAFRTVMAQRIQERLLPALQSRVQIQWSEELRVRAAETAAWLPLANLYLRGWEPTRAEASMPPQAPTES